MQERTSDATNTPYGPHFRAIRSAVAASSGSLSCSADPQGEAFGFWFGIITILLIGYSFVPTMVNG